MREYKVALIDRGVLVEFHCSADDSDHALEQAKDMYPTMSKLLLIRPRTKREIADAR